MGGVDLLVLGDCNPDLILSGQDVEPVFGQVERVVDDARLLVGGSGAILACGAVRLGLRTALVSVVGDDAFGRFMLESLADRGVDVGACVVDPSRQTGVTVILSRGEDRAILTSPGTVASLRSAAVDPRLVHSARHVHVSSYFLQTALHPGLPELLADARSHGSTTSVDPNWDPWERWNGGLIGLLSHTDLFLPNGEEAARMTGLAPLGAAAALASHGPLVAVKLGSDGAAAVRGTDLVRAPAFHMAQPPVDSTGAGDGFDAGFIYGFLAGWPLERTLALAGYCGAASLREVGGTAAQPTIEEAERALGWPPTANRESSGAR